MSELINLLSMLCLLLGCCCNIVAGLGLFRFPDFYTRMHAAGVTDSLGSSFILLGLMLQSGWGIDLSKLILILIFTLITAPTVSYTLAKAARQQGLTANDSSAVKDSTAADSSVTDSSAAKKTSGEASSNH